MVAVVTEHGYDATTVRGLAQKAAVSTRTFYQHYSGKEECFLRTQELITRRWAERIAVAQEEEGGEGNGFLLGARALLHAWLEWPEAARLVLVGACSAGPRALAQVRYSLRAIAARCSPPNVAENEPLRLISEAMVAGMAGVMRSRLLDGRSIDIEDELLSWVASCCCPVLSPGTLEFPANFERCASEFAPWVSSSNAEWGDGALAPKSDRALLLSAVSKLAASGQSDILTPKRISKAAGVSQRRFCAVFPTLTDCLVAAVAWHAEKALSRIRQKRGPSTDRFNDMSRSVTLLCVQISREPALANLCFAELGMAGADRLRCQERVVDVISTLVPNGTCGIAVEASSIAVWDVLRCEIASHRTARLKEAVPVLTYLLLAPAMRTSWALEVVEQRDYVAAA